MNNPMGLAVFFPGSQVKGLVSLKSMYFLPGECLGCSTEIVEAFYSGAI